MRARGEIVTVDEKQDEEDRRERGMGTRWRGGEDEDAGRREWRAEREEEEEDINSEPV